MLRQGKLLVVLLFSTLLFCSPAWSQDRFLDLNDGTMLDTVTSLRWLKNANCFGTQNWDTAISSAASLAAPDCGLTDGSAAGDWHLPAIEELRIFVDAGYRNNTLAIAGFSNVQGYYYWSSSTYADYAWLVDMVHGGVELYGKAGTNFVWPVRAGQHWSLDPLVIWGAVDFGTVSVGTTSPGHPFTLKNSGASSLTVTSIALSGTDSDQFTLAIGGTNPCSSLASLSLAGGASCNVVVTAKPTSTGSKSANLTFTANGASTDATLSVTGVAAVTYNSNGSTSGAAPTDSNGYTSGAPVTVLDNSGTLAKTGYVFNGWNTAADGNGTSYQPGATFSYAAPVTLYAKWSVPTAPPSGLVSWWRGEGTAIDTQARNNGTLQGSATYVPGLVGQAFNFDSSTAQYVSVPSSSSLNIYGTHSVSFWVKLTTLPPAGKAYYVVSKWANGAEHKQININADGKVFYYLFGTTAGSGATTTAVLQTGVWTHVAATYDGANMKIYINGALNASVPANNDVGDSNGTLYLGNNPLIAASYSGANFNGQLDELGWFNSALSATEIASIYNAGSAGWALPRFIDLNDGTVLDTVSSLRWLKNANCFGGQYWDTAMSSADNLASSACGLTDGTMAGDWHLPTIEELQTLVAAPDSLRYNTLAEAGFSNVQPNYYWSSSTDAGSSAWYVDMYSGSVYTNAKSYFSYHVWPVRGGQYWSLDSLLISGGADFRSVPVGSTSSGHPFTLKNSSTNPLSVTSIALSGTDSGQFTLATGGTNPCSSLTSLTLAGGAGCTVLVSAKPTTISSKSANLTVTSAGLSLNVPLSATGAALSVTYNGNGNSSGSVPVDSTGYALNATATVLDNSGVLAKSGYAFNGWNTAADGSGTSYQPGATFSIAAPTTLYAKWTPPIAPPSGLVSWWRGEGNGLDALGANNGTLHSASSFAFATGKVGQAFSFSGAATEYVDAPSSASLTFGANDFSIATWIKTTLPSAQYTWKRLVTKRATSGTWYSLALNGPVAGAVTFEIAASVNMSSNVAVNDGKWHHIAVSRDPVGTSPRKYRMYLDGVENSSLSDNGSNLDNSAPLEMGKWATESNGGIYSGLMDEVQIFSRSLSAAEIQSIYNAGPAGLALPPSISGISPSSGFASGGSTVTITGSNLSGATAVKFGSTAATSFTVNSATRITATAPAMASGQVDITVTTPSGTSATSSADQFTYTEVDQTITFNAAPTIRAGGNGLVSATASSGLTVSFSSQTLSVCSISGTTVTGLTAGTCTIAANQAGDSTYSPAGQQTQSFEIGAAVAPTVTTTAATAITRNGATLTATVNANYSSAVASFEYGTTIAYGSIATASPSPVSGGTPSAIAATISGLAPGSTYHFRVKAVNATTGTVYGEDLTFTTALTRFVDLNDGTMLDTTNSLRWLKNAQCTDEQGWADAQTWSNSLASGLCGLNDRSAVGDWHLPTIDELQTLVAAPDSYRYDTLAAAGFVNVRGSDYWSSSTYSSNTDKAWLVSMVEGYAIGFNKGFGNFVWPVRGGQYWSIGSLIVLGTGSFGALPAGSVSSGHQITLKNAGSSELPVTSITLSGADPGQFSVVAGGSSPCASLTPTLAAGASCTVLVTATPTSGGSKSASLTVTTAVGSTAVPLTATASYPVPTVTGISPSSGFASGGTSVTITGTALTGVSAVTFGTTAATGVSGISDTQVAAVSPAGVVGQIADITVTTPGGTSATNSADQFSYILQYQARNQSTTTSYATLAEAVSSASAGHEIRAYGGQFDGALSLVRDIILNGGYNMAFSAKDSLPTTLNASLTVTGGTAKVDSVTVKGVLTIGNGSLQASGVVVQ